MTASERIKFTDTFTDDVIYLIEAHEAMMKSGEPASFVEPAACRTFVVLAVSEIEFLISDLGSSSLLSETLASYFQERGSNEERVAALANSLQAKGVATDPTILDDYVALRQIRNVIVHARQWRNPEYEWISIRGFPSDLFGFHVGHWERIQQVRGQMYSYLIQALGMELGKRRRSFESGER